MFFCLENPGCWHLESVLILIHPRDFSRDEGEENETVSLKRRFFAAEAEGCGGFDE